jgi:hypothetical protein
MRARALPTLCAVLTALLCAPAATLAQNNPFGPLPPGPSPAPAQEPQAIQDPTGGSLSTFEVALIIAAALGLIGLIAVAILRDARSVAPSDRSTLPVTANGLDRETTKGSRATQQRRANQSRKRARAAKRARRHNRPA